MPVVLGIRDSELEDSFAERDQATEAAYAHQTGRLIATSVNEGDTIPGTTVPAGDYAAQAHHRGLGTVSSTAASATTSTSWCWGPMLPDQPRCSRGTRT